MLRPEAQSSRGFSLVELIIVMTLLGVLGSVISYGLCSVLPAARQEAAFSKARILDAARCSYAISTPGAAEAWDAASGDESRYALLSVAGVVDGPASGLLSSSGGYTLSLSGALRSRTSVFKGGVALSVP